MAEQPSYAGEFFDLSITSINNDYGALHNIGVMLYGINFPLSKFIKELEMILKDEAAGATDDKAEKRAKRLAFLKHCDNLPALQKLFSLFCNYLNGQDGTGGQYPNFIVITAAGGNIIIVFAQLIMNMIYAFNNSNPDLLLPTNKILLKILLQQTYPGVATIQLLNSILSSILSLIQQHFPNDSEIFAVLQEIADSPASDCDFKLSPNIFQTSDQEASAATIGVRSAFAVLNIDSSQESLPSSSQESSSQNGGNPNQDILTLLTQFANLSVNPTERSELDFIIREIKSVIENKDNAGFLLFRAKAVIDCRTTYRPTHTPQQLKYFKRFCTGEYQKLYPQIIQKTHIDKANDEIAAGTLDKRCLNYLNHIMGKKRAIKESTQRTIEQIIEIFVNGLYKQASRSGSMFAAIPPAANKTEAIINYIRNITYNINMYIQTWLTITLTSQSAPAKIKVHTPYPMDYRSLVRLFFSLDNMINFTNLIPCLSADIMHYFLNTPILHTEVILDQLINSYNLEMKGKECVMLPSDILLVPTKEYQVGLLPIKDTLDETLYSEYGYPDGLRITINAIITPDIKDIKRIIAMLQSGEKYAESKEYIYKETSARETYTGPKKSIFKKKPISKSVLMERVGGNKYYKKNITLKNKKMVKNTKYELKNKKIKHKTRKHKSKKHKTRKHKSKKHKM